jgi:hypothetical protein
MFDKGIRQRYTYGGRVDRWLRAVRCCWGFFYLILAMGIARRISREQLANSCRRSKDKLGQKMRTFENLC